LQELIDITLSIPLQILIQDSSKPLHQHQRIFVRTPLAVGSKKAATRSALAFEALVGYISGAEEKRPPSKSSGV
jgi:hypothetical protein